MADGGFRPAYNVQMATDVGSQVIVGVGVVNSGTDQGQALGMADQVFRRTGCDPGAYLMDGGFVDLDDIAALERRGIEVYAPAKELAGAGKPRWKQGAAGTSEVAGWRERMEGEAGKAVYKKRAARVSEARISTTDPDARKMKMADGGFRPAYNVQVATDVESQVIVGVGVVNSGTDQGQALGMADQVFKRTGCDPGAYLVDGGFVDLDEIVALERRGIEVYAPPKELAGAGKPGWKEGAAGTPEVAGWRERMEGEAGKAVYKKRASSAECVNALFRARYGLWRFGVRGLAKVRSVALLLAVAHPPEADCDG